MAPNPKRDFNQAQTRADAFARLVADMERLRRNIDFSEAALAKDWDKAEKLFAEGADPSWREMSALPGAFAADGSLPAAKLAEKMPPAMRDIPLIAAAAEGNRETVDYVLARGTDENAIMQALGAALRNGQRDISNILYDRLKGKDVSDDALGDMLIHRPDLYAKATASRKEPPDYIMHFMKACEVKDASAMYRALDAMTANRGTLGPNLERHKQEFEIGMGHQEALMALIQSGHVPMMARYFEDFTDLCPTNIEMFMVIAMAVTPPDVDPLQPIVEKFKPDAKTTEFAFTYAAQLGNMHSLEYLSKTFPDLAQKNAKDVLAACARQKTPDAFFDALAAGYKLPVKTIQKAEVLMESLVSGNKVVSAHIEAGMFVTPEVAVRMQSHYHVNVLRRAAELVGDWHFRDDYLFWRALSEGDKSAVAAVPADKKISTKDTDLVADALVAAVIRGDVDLIQAALERADWTAASRHKAFVACCGSPEALALFDFSQYPPHPLETDELHGIARSLKANELLKMLEGKGFAIPEAEAMKVAIAKDSLPMAEYLLGRGADLAALAPALADTLDKHASRGMVDLVERWAARNCVAPSPTDAVGVVLTKALSGDAGFDPALLVSTRDAYGNSALEILGAQGRLNDILVPQIWAGRDAAAFMKENLPPYYLPQCDFGALNAATRLLQLKSKRPGLKGPDTP